MDYCAQCGHELGVGRYCTNCGHPVGSQPAPAPGPDDLAGWRTDTAERTAATPVAPPADAPPPAWTPPPPARFPLYADEADSPGPADSPEHLPTSHRRRPWGLWLAGAALLALVAVIGVVLLTGGDGDDEPAGSAEEPTTATTTEQQPSSGGKTSAGNVANLAADATVTVPATAAPGTDVDGNPVTFEAENMLDGVPETAWRMPGDGTGSEIVVTLPQESHLRSVGMINGYAKQATGRDWYHGNRRIEQVQWAFDDGTTVDQDLDDTTGVQSVDVDVTTTTITLRLVAVSKPGDGPDRRDNTVISDLLLVGGA